MRAACNVQGIRSYATAESGAATRLVWQHDQRDGGDAAGEQRKRQAAQKLRGASHCGRGCGKTRQGRATRSQPAYARRPAGACAACTDGGVLWRIVRYSFARALPTVSTFTDPLSTSRARVARTR